MRPALWLCGHGIRSSDITRNFIARHRGRVWMNYFVETQKGSPRWDWKQMIVQENKTETLDLSHRP